MGCYLLFLLIENQEFIDSNASKHVVVIEKGDQIEDNTTFTRHTIQIAAR